MMVPGETLVALGILSRSLFRISTVRKSAMRFLIPHPLSGGKGKRGGDDGGQDSPWLAPGLLLW
jgi:hypothetical protein